MVEENMGQQFRLKDIDERRNYLIEEINQNDLMSKNNKKVCTALNYIEQSLILVSAYHIKLIRIELINIFLMNVN